MLIQSLKSSPTKTLVPLVEILLKKKGQLFDESVKLTLENCDFNVIRAHVAFCAQTGGNGLHVRWTVGSSRAPGLIDVSQCGANVFRQLKRPFISTVI